MNTHERIAVLERLLERVKRNAGQRQTSGATPPSPAVPPVELRAPTPVPPQPASAPAPQTMASSAPPSAPEPRFPTPPPIAPSASLPTFAQAAASEPPSGEWAVSRPLTPSAPAVAAREPEPLEEDAIQELELLDEEIVDITVEETGQPELPPVEPRAAASSEVEIDLEEDEEAPLSSPRQKVAASMDEALADAAEQLEPEHEVPLKTPPPESGPQAAVPIPIPEQPMLPSDFDSGVHPAEQLRVELPPTGPTNAQLGQTIELEEARGPALELEEMRASEAAAVSSTPQEREELEAPLSVRAPASGPALRPATVPPEPPFVPPLAPPPAVVEPARVEAAPLAPEITARPVLAAASPARFARPAPAFAPATFIELLDASLSLDAD